MVVFPLMAVATALFRIYSARAYRRMRERLGRRHGDAAGGPVRRPRHAGVPAARRPTRELRRRQRHLPRAPTSGPCRLNAYVLPGRRAAVARSHGDRVRLRRLALLRGRDRARHAGGVHRATCRTSSTRCRSCRSSTTRSWPPARRSTRSSTCMDTRAGARSTRPAPASSTPIDGAVDLDGVHFGYGDGREVLHGLDLHVAAGQTVALVGHTGAGKSTIVKLLARFYDPTAGAIRIDGQDLRDVTQSLAAPAARHRAAGGLPVRATDPREHRLRAARGDARRGARGGHARSAPTASSRRCRDGYDTPVAGARRARSRSGSASWSRSRGRCCRPAPADPRRGHVERRHRDGGAHRGGDRAPARRPHGVRRRPPPVDDPPRRPDRRARERPRRRAAARTRSCSARAAATARSTATGSKGRVSASHERPSPILRGVGAGSSARVGRRVLAPLI